MTLITKSEELMAVSVRQGVELAAIEDPHCISVWNISEA